MAKKKKKTILTAEEYKAQNGMLVTADQYRSQQAAANARKQAEEKAAANARSQAMTNSWRKMSQDETYSGGRTAGNTFGTYALKQQYDRAKNKKTFFNDYMNQLAQKRTEANKKLTQDATYLMDGKGDPGIAYRSVMSGADSTDARKRLNKYAQEEKQFNLDVQHARNERLVKGDYSGIDFGGHMGKYTDDLKETFYLPNISTRNIEASQLKKRGYGNSGTDWSTYSDNDALQKKKDELLAQKEYYKNRHTDPYEALEEKGQFTPVYSAWGESEGTQEAAKRFHQSIKGRNKDDINPQTIMDSIYGSGTYSYETQGMTDIERQRLDDDIMNRFYQMERPETGVDIYGQMEQERKTNEDMTNYLTGEIGKIDRQMEHNNEYNELMNAETGGDRSFHPENDYVSEEPIDVQRFDLFYNMTSPSVDVISSFINRGAVYDDWMKVSGRLPDGMKNVAHMLPEEIGKFNEYYNAGQKDKAMAFIEGLQYALGQRNQYYENVQKKYETTQAPVLSYLNTFTEKAVLQPAEMLGVIAGRIFGDKRVEDPDSGYWAITNDINKTRQFVTEDMDKITRFFVETGTSAVDSFANVLMGNSMGLSEKALEYTVLGFFGTQAFQTSMNQNLRESNGDWAHSFAEATLDTLIETATEIFSVEKLLSDPSKFLEYLFKNAIAEGSEEFVGATFGPLIHEMLLHNNEWRERAAQIWRDGGYADDNGNFVKVGSEEDAYRQAMKEWNHDIFRSTLSGALSTGGAAMVGGVQNVGNRMFGRYQEAGRQIRNAETAGTNGQQVLLDAALSMKEGTKSNKQAQKIQEKLKANEKISDFEIGKLAENIYKESNEQAAEAARTVVEDNAFEKLEKTKMDVVQSREMARIISEAVMKGGVNNLSRSDRSILMGSVEGFNVYKDFISFQDETKNSQTVRDTMDAIMDATRESVERQQSVSELLDGRKGQAVKQAEDAGEQLASEEDIRNASGAAVEGARGVIVDGQWAKLGNLVKTEDGSLKWQVTADGKQKTVDASQIRAADFATANIMRQAAANPGMYSNGFTNMMLAQNELGKVNNVGRYLLDAQRIRMAAYTGMQIPANTLGSETARALYDFSKAEHEQNRQAQVKEGNAGKQGRVTFMGAVYGSQEWNKAISSIKNTNQRAQIDYIAGIAQRAGIEVTFRDAKDVAKEMGVKDAEKYYGWENGKGISINVEGLDFMLGEDGKAVAKGNHNMVVTFGHEMTHWLQRNSLQGYNQLESFVLNEMRRNGVNVNRRINSVMNRLNLNMEDAISEIVADSCDQILANEEVAQHIQETNKGLFNEIKGFVKNLIGRMKNAIKGMDESQSRDARAMMNSANRLAKVWLGAYDEAISGAIRQGEANVEDETRLSFADMQKLTWDQQIDKMLGSNASSNDVMELAKTEELKDIDVDVPIALRQSVLRKMMRDPGMTKRSGHKMTKPEILKIKESLIHPVAKITRGNVVYLISDQLDYNGDPIMLVGEKVKQYVKGGAIDTKSIYGRTNVTTLFGKYVDGQFVPYDDAKIWKYKENANDILSLSPEQLGAGPDVFDAIERLTQNEGNGKSRLSQADLSGQKNIEGSSANSIVRETDKVENSQNVPSTDMSIKENALSVNDDQAYQDAVERGELETATNMLMDKLQRTEGVIPYMANRWDVGRSREISRLIKMPGMTEAIAEAAADMAQNVPENAVLIPMPDHTGKVTDETDTAVLAKAISELTGRPVVYALEGEEHGSRHEAKARGEAGATVQDLAFRKIAEIPEGTFPIFVDNIVGKGITAAAAREAFGGGITLAYSKTARSKGLVGLKNATITYDKNGNLIPLSQRFDVSKRDVRFSQAQLDNEYMQAVKDENVQRQQELVRRAAEEAGYTLRGTHRTNAEFIVFDKSMRSGKNGKTLGDGFYIARGEGTEYDNDSYGKNRMVVYVNPGKVFNLTEGLTKRQANRIYDKYFAPFHEDKYNTYKPHVIEKLQSPIRLMDYIIEAAETNNTTTDEIFKWLGYDSIKDGPQYAVFDSEQIKSAEPVTYDDNGNVIPLSERFNPESEDIRLSQAQLDDEYMLAVKDGNVQRQQAYVDQAADNAGYRIRAYHGTGRADRVGTVFRADRATSGPMAFFTDNKQIAENYSRDKRDTSIAYDEEYGDYKTQFRVKNRYGKEVPVGELWNSLTYSEKRKITEAAKHIAWDDAMEEIIYDPDAKQGNGGFNEWTLRDKRGNAIDALMEAWLYGGDLYEQEERFLDVLKMAGIENVKWNDPNYREEKVYDTYLKIQNPFDTSTMYTGKFLEDLESWWMFQDKDLYEHEDMGADFWDKNGISVDDWISYGFDDTANGNTRNWTRIPDGVTAYLKELGYDGIKDQGGKDGGIGHTVWIPFSSEQIKSAEPVTYDDQGNVIPLSERFNPEKVDIRWSQADMDPKQAELSEAWQKARDEANDLREQLRKMKPEMDAWVDRITEAQKAGKMDDILAEYKEWEKGYTKLRDEQYEAEQRYKQANKAYDDYIEQRDVAEEQKKIQASGLSEPEYRRKQAVNTFGYTTDFREAGYLLPNGRMLNFTGEKGKHYGTRGEDHRGISTIYASSEYQGGAAMMAFMRDGNIRVMAETPGVDIIASKEPTTEQYAAIRNMARRFAGEEYFNVDFTDDRGFNVDSIEYDGRVNPERIVNDIKTFFRTGAAPQQSVVSQFHYSKADLENLDAGAWIGSLTPGQVQTEAERDLINNYKGRRVSIQLSIKKQLDYKAKIKQLTDNIDKLTPAQLDDLKTLQDKLAAEQEKHARLEDELFQITSAEGYAGLMYRQNQILNNFILGKTQDQVRQTVDEMVKETQKAKEEIAKQAEELKKLAQTQAVQTMKSYLGKTSLKFAAKSLKSELNSSMKNGEIENRLAEMALKKANGESIAEDARLLAIDMTNQMRGYQLDVMERLRGVTITIGPDEQAEMKGNGMTLASVREQLKGTGVKVKYGDYSSLDTDTQDGGDLRVLLPELPQEISENSADAMFRFISWAQSMREGDLAAKQSMVDIDDAALNVMALASTVTTEMTNDPAAKKQIDKLLKQVQDLSGRTEEIAGKMSDVMDQMDNIELAGTKAVGWASVLQRDVHVAIDYYNKIARMAAQEERNTVRKNLIEQLKSENTRKLVQQQEKYQELMKQDRKARELAQDNLSLRNRISTVASRINKRLTAETDQKNVPEEAKPLARQMLKMLLEHDFVYRHVLMANKQQREASLRAMKAFDQRDGGFDMDRDLDWLIVGQGEDADYDIHDRIVKDLIDIETGLMEYRTAEGQKNISLMDRKEALKKIDKAVTEIWSVIQARETANINHKNMLVSELAMQARDNMDRSRFKGEWTGVIGHGIQGLRSGVVYGNMTPEYFFKNLRNKTISQLYDEYHRAENRNGLEVGRAQKKLAQIAEETGYKNWDPKKRYTFKLIKGGTVSLTLGEMMSLYATWEREKLNQIEVNGPEESYHMKVGGFYTQQEEQHKVLGREVFNQRAHRLTEEDMTKIMEAMTPEQIEYVDRVVKYMTNEIGALGNEASMRMYGIKKYNEKWYFPFEIWEGVKSKKSDQGAAGNTENRAAHQSFTKRRVNNASNALVIRDFTETAVKHIGQMINYNTFAPAIEFMNRVMNYQMAEEGEGEDSSTKRNLRAIFGEIYGKDAVKYLDDFNRDVNGGVTRPDTTIYDRLLSTFKKSAVAGSASVALQQPLSYIRAAMMISPKYLATSIKAPGPHLKQIVEEMRKYSGVAVIKKMGKFDMNLGRSAIDYMMPDAKESTGRAIYNKASDIVTMLPELMDTWTWCNMWEAVKKEQAAQNPGMDKTSDEFLEKVAERFNDVIRKTQVYDSVLVKSKNMRNTNPIVKSFTSFMSEPTLTANVLYDAVINAKEKGGMQTVAKAATTFVMSAILQAIVKGIISAGRSPQDKKTWDENVAYRTGANLISELNPMNLLPGYNDLMVLFKEGELSDDALSVVGKILEAGKTGIRWIQGKSENPWYRDLEDTAGVISQLFTNIPAKNLLRDMRAITNYIKKPWADRANSADVLKYQLLDQIHTADNMTGVLNTWLGDKGWETKNAGYFKRIYQADKAGKQEKVASMINYLTLARGTKETTINSGLRDLAKKDSSLTEQQKLDKQKQYGLKDANGYITSEYKEGKISRNEAEKMYRKENPKAENKKVYETFDRIDYTKAGKLEDGEYYSSYLPLYDAIEANNQGEIKQAIKKMLSYGYKKENIQKQLGTKYKNDYIQADTKKRGQIQNKLIKAYRELGVRETEAIGIMQKWVTDYNKKQGNK